MKIVMDADCLIKLTKAGLKEEVCRSMTVFIPGEVKRETVDQADGRPDSTRIAENIKARLIHVKGDATGTRKGESAVLDLYNTGTFDAVASDDHRFLKHLRGLGVPFAVPAALVVLTARHRKLDNQETLNRLLSLKPYVSQEQYAVAAMSVRQE